MKTIPLLLTLFLSAGCHYHQTSLSEKETENELKKVFQASLYKSINNDSNRAKYYVNSVIFYEDPSEYNCEFRVRMVQPNLDTTGIMTALISRDFKTIKRKQ